MSHPNAIQEPEVRTAANPIPEFIAKSCMRASWEIEPARHCETINR